MTQYAKHFRDQYGMIPVAYDRSKRLIARGDLGLETDQTKKFKAHNIRIENQDDDYYFIVTRGPTLRMDLDSVIHPDLASRNISPISAIDLILKQSQFHNDSFISAGRAFYEQAFVQDLGGGKILRKGFFMSTRPVQGWKPIREKKEKPKTKGPYWQLSLNVDTANSAFYKPQPVVDLFCELLRCRDPRDLPRNLDQRNRRMLEREMKAVRVMTCREMTNFRLDMKLIGQFLEGLWWRLF
jgi:hypothetical protein